MPGVGTGESLFRLTATLSLSFEKELKRTIIFPNFKKSAPRSTELHGLQRPQYYNLLCHHRSALWRHRRGQSQPFVTEKNLKPSVFLGCPRCHGLMTLSSVLVRGHIFLYTPVFLPHSPQVFKGPSVKCSVYWGDAPPAVCLPVLLPPLQTPVLPAYMCPGQYVPQSLPDSHSFRKGRATEYAAWTLVLSSTHSNPKYSTGPR